MVTEPTPAALPAAHPPEAALAQVASLIVPAPLGVLSYAVPQSFANEVCIGTPLVAPLGTRQVTGYVLGLQGHCAMRGHKSLREVVAIDRERPALPADVIALLDFASRYYCASPGELLGCALPAAARPAALSYRLTPQGQARLALAEPTERMAALLRLGQAHPKGFGIVAAMRALGISRPQLGALLRRAVAQALLQTTAKKASMGRTERVYTRCAEGDATQLGARHVRARHLLGLIVPHEARSLAQLRQLDTNPAAPLRTLLRLGLVRAHSRRVEPEALCDAGDASDAAEPIAPVPAHETAPRVLSDEQQQAIAALLDPSERRPTLLFGVTGSGKTEVYLRVMAETLARGQTALMLVPEIALTPQLARAFRERFGSLVATFHSGLTVAERRDEWERIHAGEAKIGLGARSAIFLPLRNLGLIVVDEEHESSFKQDESPRYNARDLAIWRAQHVGARIILGSATPSLESWHNAQRKRFALLTLHKRVKDRPLPAVEVVHLREHAREPGQLMAEPMLRALRETLARDEQAILFLNRRGFAPYVFCRDCGHSFRCEDCDVSLTLHRGRDVLLCHYCGMFIPTPEHCRGCGGLRVESQGAGCERLEAEVRAHIGDVEVVRLDRDTIRGRKDLERALGRFRRRQAQVLVGTQMVAKGHDFPGVTLVGIVSADNSLNFPDFRAAERTFALLTQVAGRAGRGELPGRVLVQSFEPEHPAIVAALRHDFLAFAQEELRHRHELYYPPFSHVCLVRFEGEDLPAVEAAARVLEARWRTALASFQDELWVLGPAPAPLARLRRLYRVHLVLKAKHRSALRTALGQLPPAPAGGVRRIVDVDPLNLL